MNLQMNKFAAPQLKNYLSAIQFLADFYTYRKSVDVGFSYDAWASELGFKSRSFLKMVLTGKRAITAQFIDSVAKSMLLTKDDTDYFSLLVAHDQAQTQIEKSLYLEKIFEVLGNSKDRAEILAQVEFLSEPALPKLQVLLSFKDIDKSPAGLATILDLPTEDVTKHLHKLQQLQLAKDDGEWVAIKKSFRVPKNFGCIAQEEYHNASLREAIAAQKLPSHLRRFRSLLLPLSEEDFVNLNADIDALISKTLAKYDHDDLVNRRLYKMNFNLFPVTELVLSPENTTGLQYKTENTDTNVSSI